MSVDAHVLNLLPAYALDCLAEEERTSVSDHLVICPNCRAELQAYLAVTGQLALATPTDATPPVDLKQRLTNRIQASSQLRSASPSRTSWRLSLQHLLTWQPLPAWSLAGLALILVLLAGNLLLWQQLNRSKGTPQLRGMQTLALVNTHLVPEANGVIIVTSDGEYGSVVVENLPPLAPEQRYQLWLIRDGKIDSGTIFSVDHAGYRAKEVHAPDDLANYVAFSITIEPAAGSPQPTGDEVLTSAGFSLQASP
jgi:anti-sigma-K factor RskA